MPFFQPKPPMGPTLKFRSKPPTPPTSEFYGPMLPMPPTPKFDPRTHIIHPTYEMALPTARNVALNISSA